MAIKAKFAGVCSRTGKAYKAGTMIEKWAGGWAIVGDQSPRATPTHTVRMDDGTVKQVPASQIPACGKCVKADGIDPKKPPKGFQPETYHMAREGDAFVCHRCGRRFEIITQAEQERQEFEEMQKSLHLRPVGYGFYQLSHRVPASMWERVAEHFTFWSADDMDEMDYFDMPGGYYLLGDPPPTDEPLNGAPSSSMTRAQAVEEALGILPENRLAVLIPMWEQQAKERAEREEERKAKRAEFRRLFEEGEHTELPQGARQNWESINLRPGASTTTLLLFDPDGIHVWYYFNTWADMDYTITRRHELTPERRELIEWVREHPGIIK